MEEGEFNSTKWGPALPKGFYKLAGGLHQIPGLPDFWGSYQGVSIAFEVKRNENKLNPKQALVAAEMIHFGKVLYCVVRFWDAKNIPIIVSLQKPEKTWMIKWDNIKKDLRSTLEDLVQIHKERLFSNSSPT